MAYFGTSGNPQSFYDNGGKATVDVFKYLSDYGLNAYEYQCGKGVTTGEKTAALIGEAAAKENFKLSLHSPYYISLANPTETAVEKNLKYIMDSVRVASAMGADRVVVHAGSLNGFTQKEAVQHAINMLQTALSEMNAQGYLNIALCPELMGKSAQLGDLEDIVAICASDDRLIPTIDFGHYNARTLGSIKSAADIDNIFEGLSVLNGGRSLNFHSHFSKIEYTAKGESKHLTFADDIYGPDFIHVASSLKHHKCEPIFICESDGTQASDAQTMKTIWEKA